ncbi:MAG TPA: 4-hydroxybenzoate polyprenyltransferase, partial [Actinoallomurus sp.]|nr:4-hydroxybenzoate polyprenyltransferase [Actinoallomurus sp.]
RLLRQVAGAGLLGSYVSTAGRAQLAAVADPGADRIRRAVGAGILGLIPLQASLAALTGALPVAAAVAAGFPLARRLSRKVSPT